MKIIGPLAVLAALVICLSCSDSQDPSKFEGRWNIDSYELNEIRIGQDPQNLSQANAGSITFMSDGTGTISLEVPGLQFPTATEITWTEEENALIINWSDNPELPNIITYAVEVISDSQIELLNATYGNAVDRTTFLRISKQ
jgi:hypothetical protein